VIYDYLVYNIYSRTYNDKSDKNIMKTVKTSVGSNKFTLIHISIILVFLVMLTTSDQYASAVLYDGTKAGVMLTFEHATSNQLPSINSEMIDIVGTIAPLPTRIGASGHMTQQQLLDLQARGFEIASHSETHASISSSTSASTLYYETVQSKIDLENMGFIVNGFIQPSNKMTTASFELIKNNYKWTSFFSPLTYQPQYMTLQTLNYSKTNYGIYHEYAHGVGNSYALNTFAKVKEKIDYAIANKFLIAFKFHGIKTGSSSYLTSPVMFKDIVDYLKQQRDLGKLDLLTRSQGIGDAGIVNPVTTASPVGGTYGIAKSVSLITNIQSTIYYTTDGTLPDTSSTVYSTPIPISNSTTLKYFATANGLTEPVKTQIYTIDTIKPITTASPLGGIYTTIQSVSLTANEPSTIYYTKDGTEPTTLSFKYATVIPMSATTTLKYFAVDTIGNKEPANTQVYNIVIPDTTAPVTTASPPAGTYYATQLVTLTANKPSVIHFAIDDTVTTSSETYSDPIPIPGTLTLNFFAVGTGGTDESPKTQVYTIDIDQVKPVITPNGSSASIVLGSTYTELGATVTDNDPAYAGTVTVSGATVNTSIPGDYIITYNAPADAAGNIPNEKSITITVLAVVPITFDNSNNNGGALCSSSTCSINLTVAPGNSRMIIVAIADEGTSTVSSVDITGGTSQGILVGSKQVGSGTTTQNIAMWRIMDSYISSGSNIITVHFATVPSGAGISVMSFANVKQQPEEAEISNTVTSNASISTGITTLTDGALIVSVVGNGQGGGTYTSHGTGQTERHDFAITSAGNAVTTEIKDIAGLDSQSHTYSTTANRQAQYVASFAPAT
jgi:hypothetical protein